jgi:branched-chain amino acid transport system permease protein
MPAVFGDYGLRLFNGALIAAIAVLGLNFILGYTGLISLMHASTVGMGAYTLAILTAKAGFSPWVALFLSIVASAAFSYLAGIVLLRLKGHYFALATLGINVSFGIIVSNLVGLTGGTNGIPGLPNLTVAGFAVDSEARYFYLALIVLFVLANFSYAIRKSDLGRAMIAVRDDEMAASVSGLDVTKIKVMSLAIGGAYAGLAGVLFALHAHFVSPEDFNFSHSIVYLAMLVVGGEGSISGAMMGAIVVSLLPELLRGVGEAYLMVFGTLTLIILIVLPRGLAGFVGRYIPAITTANRCKARAQSVKLVKEEV